MSDVRAERQRQLSRAFQTGLKATHRAALRRISKAATDAHLPLFLVGGAVRDLLLGRRIRDLDLAVEGALDPLLARLDLPTTRHRGFGTATVEAHPDLRIDLAHTRRESYAHPAALPRVRAADIETDLRRRDFTANAMALEIERGRPGKLIDPLNGWRDIGRRRLRILHPDSFMDDPTRAYRAIRLAAELGFTLERSTAHALRESRRNGVFEKLSPARLRHEVVRMLESPQSIEALQFARRTRLLRTFVDGEARHATRERLAWLTRRLRRLRRSHPAETICERLSVLALCLWPDGSPDFTIARLEPVRRERLALAQIPFAATARAAIDASPIRPSRVVEACQPLPTELLLVLAAVGTERRRGIIDRFLGQWRFLKPDIDAQMLLDRGIPRGPRLAAGLRRARAGKLDGTARTARQQLALALDDSGNS